MPRVLVGIATYKRPIMLEAALRSLTRLDTKADVQVLVVDNSPAGEGVAVVERLAVEGYRFALSVRIVTERGIPQARNAVVDEALANPALDFLAFMDDDQVAAPQWLDAMLTMHARTGAEVVGSAVYPKFEIEPAWWLADNVAFRRDTISDGEVPMLNGTGGLLLQRSYLKRLGGVWFDPSFALTGGEDADFLQRLRVSGARFARAKASILHEVYPARRVSLGWVLRRAYRTGSTDMRINLSLRQGWRFVAVEVLKVSAAMMLSTALIVVSIGRPAKQVDALCKLWRALGKASAMLGSRYDEYATTHGR